MKQNNQVTTDFSDVKRVGEQLKFREIEQNLSLNRNYANHTFLLRHKIYHYKELLRVALTNFQTDQFQNFRKSTKIMIAVPLLVGFCFQIVNPFSIFYKSFLYGSMIACIGNVGYSLRQDLFRNAKSNTSLGAKLRDHFTELSYYDSDVMSFQDYTKKYNKTKKS